MLSNMLPHVSVILPVYNGERKYLRDTVMSILVQSHHHFELIIIDDGSTDGTSSILQELRTLDRRITILRNAKNEGLVRSLNRGLNHASSQFIARIDCGDLAEKKRIEIQSRFLQEHSDYVLVASQAEWITMSGDTMYTTHVPSDDREIRKRLFIKDSILIHPAVMFKKIPGLYYREIAATAEDYDYWLRLSMHGKMFVIDDSLLKMRMDPDGTTYSKKMRQVKTVDLIHASFFMGPGSPSAQREWSVVELSGIERIQERLFHLFSRYAYQYYHRSVVLFYTFKILSGLSSPQYMFKLFNMMLRRRSVSSDPLFQQYLSWAERSADREIRQ